MEPSEEIAGDPAAVFQYSVAKFSSSDQVTGDQHRPPNTQT